MALPDFLLIGAPKAGTTALHVALSRHPQLFLSANKEPKYFLTADEPPIPRGGPGDARTIAAQVWRRSDYEALFEAARPGQLRGESTTLYLRDRDAHRRIRDLIPEAKLIAILRDPVDRAHSNWTHLHSAGLEPEDDFVKACDLEAERIEKGWAPFWRYVEQGRYGEQIEHLYSLFPKEQVLVLLYRDYRDRPTETVDEVCAFLGVETGLVDEVPTENKTAASSRSIINDMLRRTIRYTDLVGRHVPLGLGQQIADWAKRPTEMLLQREQQGRSPLAPEQRVELIARFVDDVKLLEQVTGRSFSHWLDPHNTKDRAALDAGGRFGTAYRSIDRPPTR